MGEWPWEAIAAVAGLALTHFVKPLLRLLRADGEQEIKWHEAGWERAVLLEEEIVLLRKALHRQLADRNAYSTALEIIVLALKLPVGERAEAVRQAREIIEQSLAARSLRGTDS